VLSQPQLYQEGNLRTGSLIASGILLQSGCPPFVLTRQNAVAYFNPSPEIKFTDKRTIRGKLRLPKERSALTDDIRAMIDATDTGIIGVQDRALTRLRFAGAF
jgi:hypothetical protein